MPWRLFLTLLLCTLLIVFVGLNLDNRASISFGFYTFNDVPVFVSMFISFVCGAVVMLPFTFGRRKKKIKQKDDTKKLKGKDESATENLPIMPEPGKEKAPAAKKKLFGKKKSEALENSKDVVDETAR